MNNKILFLGLITIMMVTIVSAGIFDWLKEEKEISQPQVDSLITMNVSDKIFTTKVTNLDKGKICIKDLQNNAKIVKADKCESDKIKYTLVDISNSNMLYKNSQGLVRIKNE